MIEKIVRDLVRQLLLLEIHIRGIRIKPSAWRQRLIFWMVQHEQAGPPGLKIFMHNQKKTAYLNMPKAGGSSFKLNLFESANGADVFQKKHKNKLMVAEKFQGKDLEVAEVPNITASLHWQKMFLKEQINADEINAHFIFTFARNPFTRLVSFFQQKYKYRDGYHYSGHKLHWPVKRVASFSEMAHKISNLPDGYLEQHILPQHIVIECFAKKDVRPDFIGKFEKLKEEFDPIRRRFDLPPLSHENKSLREKQNWRDYYTLKTAKLVYKRYRKDFEMFGYEEEYPKLLDYLASKSRQDR